MLHTQRNRSEATCRCSAAGGFGAAEELEPQRRPDAEKKIQRSGRSIAAVLGFLVLFAILVILVSKFYLIPGFIAAQHATHAHRRKMAAEALLLMCVMLMILLVGLLISFRISRFFFPPPTDARTRTKVVDAWAEAGKRIEEESPEEEE
jgi:hypothetical protein